MPPPRSYAELMASRPAALRKPLLQPSPARVPAISIATRPQEMHVSTAGVADSPRRLLSYYLSKAAYNTDESAVSQSRSPSEGAAPSPHRAPHHIETAPARVVVPAEDASLITPSADLLRPPPLSAKPFSQHVSLAQPASVEAPLLSTPAARPPKAVSFAPSEGETQPDSMQWQQPVRQVAEAPEPAPLRRARTPPAEPPPSSSSWRPSNSWRLPPSAPLSPLPAAAPAASAAAAHAEEEQRRFEALVMSQVEVLLQAQRSESYAELESYRLAATEAQATLENVEAALTEYIGSAAASCLVANRGDAASSVPASLPPSPAALPVETLAMDMSRVAAAAAPTATQQLLDAIMYIEEGEDVPSALGCVVQELFTELTQALVPPVMAYVKSSCERLAQQHARSARPAGGSFGSVHEGGGGQLSSSSSPATGEALSRAEAEVAVLQDEVQALRRTLGSTAATGCVVAGPTTLSSSHAQPTSHETVLQALQDRFFTECHAMLIRSRQETMALRRALEKERRQHFLTRLQLLKPPPPSMPAIPTKAPNPDVAASPKPRGGEARSRSGTRGESRDTCAPPSAVQERAASSSPIIPPTPRASSARAPHPWTPSETPVQMIGSERGEAEGDEEEDGSFTQDEMSSFVESNRAIRQPPHSHPAARQTAVRVADAVLRTTRRTDGPADQQRRQQHPYDSGAYSNADEASTSSGQAAWLHAGTADAAPLKPGWSESAAAVQRYRSRNYSDGPSVSFADVPSNGASIEDRREHAPQNARTAAATPSLIRVLNRASTRAVNSSLSQEDDTESGAAGRPLDEDHEKRVWSKAVELLSRYSVA